MAAKTHHDKVLGNVAEEYPVLEVLKGPVGQNSDSNLVTLKVASWDNILFKIDTKWPAAMFCQFISVRRQLRCLQL